MNRQYFFTTVLALVMSSVFFGGCKSQKKALAVSAPPAQQQQVNNQKETKPPAVSSEEDGKDMAVNEETSKSRLAQYFEAIAKADNVTSANASIEEAMNLFASPQTPVLIVISNENGQKDYDRPTSIKAYLNYLKDQKQNINTIGQLKMDENGKITEVELTKTNQIK